MNKPDNTDILKAMLNYADSAVEAARRAQQQASQADTAASTLRKGLQSLLVKMEGEEKSVPTEPKQPDTPYDFPTDFEKLEEARTAVQKLRGHDRVILAQELLDVLCGAQNVIAWNPGTKQLDSVDSATINGHCVQINVDND